MKIKLRLVEFHQATLYVGDMSLGTKLKMARETAALTQRAVADLMAVSTQAVSSWERDKNLPELFRVAALAKIYNVKWEWLLDPDADDAPIIFDASESNLGRAPIIDPLEIIDFMITNHGKNLFDYKDRNTVETTLEYPGQSFAISTGYELGFHGFSKDETVIFNNSLIPNTGDFVAALEKFNGSLRPIFGILSDDQTLNGVIANIPIRRDEKGRSIVATMLQTKAGASVVGTAIERRLILRWSTSSNS